jgi:hypothetical protein
MRLLRWLAAVALLIGADSTASAQTYRCYGDCGSRARGYYGTPYGSGGGDQYGCGPQAMATPVTRLVASTGAETTTCRK